MPDLTLTLLNAPNAGPLSLHEKQDLFSRLVPRLLDQAHALGFTVSGGEWWRSNEEAARLHALGKGILLSLHADRLAIDLNLFDTHGAWITDSAAYQPLGEWWEAQSQLPLFECCWGGRFLDDLGKPKPDGDHFSIGHGGRK